MLMIFLSWALCYAYKISSFEKYLHLINPRYPEINFWKCNLTTISFSWINKKKRKKRNKKVEEEGGGSPKITNLEHTYFLNDPPPKAVSFSYFHENRLKMMNVFYFIWKPVFFPKIFTILPWLFWLNRRMAW